MKSQAQPSKQSAKGTAKSELADAHKVMICQGIAQFKEYDKIIDEVLGAAEGAYDDHADVRQFLHNAINYHKNHPDRDERWVGLIADARETWRKGILEVPLANVRERVNLIVRDVERIEKRLKRVDEGAGAADVDDLTALMKTKLDQLDQIAVQSGQKVAKSQQDVDMRAQVAAGIGVELRMPDFTKQVEDTGDGKAPEEPTQTEEGPEGG